MTSHKLQNTNLQYARDLRLPCISHTEMCGCSKTPRIIQDASSLVGNQCNFRAIGLAMPMCETSSRSQRVQPKNCHLLIAFHVQLQDFDLFSDGIIFFVGLQTKVTETIIFHGFFQCFQSHYFSSKNQFELYIDLFVSGGYYLCNCFVL